MEKKKRYLLPALTLLCCATFASAPLYAAEQGSSGSFKQEVKQTWRDAKSDVKKTAKSIKEPTKKTAKAIKKGVKSMWSDVKQAVKN